MDGEKIASLNAGFEKFCESIEANDRAKKRAEVAVITFGGVARVDIDFTEGRDLPPRQFAAVGGTPMGAALDIAMDELEAQKAAYKAAGLEYYRPWLFLISDGAPTDGDVFDRAVRRVRTAEAAKGVTVFCVGVGVDADLAKLNEIGERDAVMLDGYAFEEMFTWLSNSIGAVAHSPSHGQDEEEIKRKAEDPNAQVALQPANWFHA
jgi:uncharacterized protein YegL